MTCIVGLVHDGEVHIGADSAGVGGLDLMIRADLKCWEKDGWIFGFTSSFRMGQLLRYSLVIPKRHPETDLMEFMVTQFVEAVRTCLKTGGYATAKDGGEVGGCFLVGHAGRLFRVDSDYQVGEAVLPFDAVGCGDAYAKGALYVGLSTGGEPYEKINGALAAAQAMSAGVRGPFHFVSLPATAAAG